MDDSVHSRDLKQHDEGNDSDVDDFIIIDDDDDCNDSDDNELVVDLTSTDVELMPEPSISQPLVDNSSLTSGHTNKHDVARNVQRVTAEESRTDHSALSDKDLWSSAQRNESCNVGHQRQRHQSFSNGSCIASDKNRSVKYIHGPCEHVKHTATEQYERTMASESHSADTYQHAVHTKTTAAFKPNYDYLKVSQCSSTATAREMDGKPSEGHATRSTRNACTVPVSSSSVRRCLETSIDKDSAESWRKVLKSNADINHINSLSVSTCLADVTVSNLGRLERHMEARVKAAEQKATLCKQYACSLDNLDESEKRQLVVDGLAEPAVISEFSVELRLLSVLRDIDKTETEMAKIRSQFNPTCLSMSPEEKYDQLERACNKKNTLIVRRDWCYMRMQCLRRYYKSRCLLTLPNDLRFSSELGKYVSVEGVPLILNDFTISLRHCKRLAALLLLIKRLRRSCLTTSMQDVRKKLGWLHEERKTLLNEICCSSEQKIGHTVECLSEKLTLYKYVI